MINPRRARRRSAATPEARPARAATIGSGHSEPTHRSSQEPHMAILETTTLESTVVDSRGSDVPETSHSSIRDNRTCKLNMDGEG